MKNVLDGFTSSLGKKRRNEYGMIRSEVKPVNFSSVAELVECHQCQMDNPLSSMLNCLNKACNKSYCIECVGEYKQDFNYCYSCQKVCKCKDCKLGLALTDQGEVNPNKKVVKIDDFCIIEDNEDQESEDLEDSDNKNQNSLNILDQSQSASLKVKPKSKEKERVTRRMIKKRKALKKVVKEPAKPKSALRTFEQQKLGFHNKLRVEQVMQRVTSSSINQQKVKRECVLCRTTKSSILKFRCFTDFIVYLYYSFNKVAKNNQSSRSDSNDNYSRNVENLKSYYNKYFLSAYLDSSQSFKSIKAMCSPCLETKMTTERGFYDLFNLMISVNFKTEFFPKATNIGSNKLPPQNKDFNQKLMENISYFDKGTKPSHILDRSKTENTAPSQINQNPFASTYPINLATYNNFPFTMATSNALGSMMNLNPNSNLPERNGGVGSIINIINSFNKSSNGNLSPHLVNLASHLNSQGQSSMPMTPNQNTSGKDLYNLPKGGKPTQINSNLNRNENLRGLEYPLLGNQMNPNLAIHRPSLYPFNFHSHFNPMLVPPNSHLLGFYKNNEQSNQDEYKKNLMLQQIFQQMIEHRYNTIQGFASHLNDPQMSYQPPIHLANIPNACNPQSMFNAPQIPITPVPIQSSHQASIKPSQIPDNDTTTHLYKLEELNNIMTKLNSSKENEPETYNANLPKQEVKLSSNHSQSDFTESYVANNNLNLKEGHSLKEYFTISKAPEKKDEGFSLDVKNAFQSKYFNTSNPLQSQAKRLDNDKPIDSSPKNRSKDSPKNQPKPELLSLLGINQKKPQGQNPEDQSASNAQSLPNSINPSMINPNTMINMVEDLKKQFFSIQYFSILQKLFISYTFKNFDLYMDQLVKYHTISETVINSIVAHVDDKDKKLKDMANYLKSIITTGTNLSSALNTNLSSLKSNGIKTFKNLDENLKTNVKLVIESFGEAFGPIISKEGGEDSKNEKNSKVKESLIEGMRRIKNLEVPYSEVIPKEMNNLYNLFIKPENQANKESDLVEEDNPKTTLPKIDPEYLKEGLKKFKEDQESYKKMVATSELIRKIKGDLSFLTSSKAGSLRTLNDKDKNEEVIKTNFEVPYLLDSSLNRETELVREGEISAFNTLNCDSQEAKLKVQINPEECSEERKKFETRANLASDGKGSM